MTAFKDRMIDSAPHRWRVLEAGSGPLILCLHGAGASADSFRSVMASLSDRYRLVAPDLPGHGRTRLGRRNRSGLAAMSEDVARLAETFGAPVHGIIGHSAGGAIALHLQEALSPRGQVLINPALAGFSGAAGLFFPLIARALTHLPLVPDVISARLSRGDRLRTLLRQTGSPINAEIEARYAALARSGDHIKGTLMMMAAWDLDELDLPTSETPPVLVLLARDDATVPPSSTARIVGDMSGYRIEEITGGHLAHELPNKTLIALIRDYFASLVPAGTRPNRARPAP